jgi:hypothetical protein
MAGPLVSIVLMEFEIIQFVNEVLYYANCGECSSGDDCMQVVIPGTHAVKDGDSGDDSVEQRIATHVDEKSIGLGGVSVKSVQQDIITNFAVWETLMV